jgi:hypothetical protein
MALDTSGHGFATWVQHPSSGSISLQFATNASGTWVAEPLVSPFTVDTYGSTPQPVVDAAGVVHVLFWRSSPLGLVDATRGASGGWTTTAVVPGATNHFRAMRGPDGAIRVLTWGMTGSMLLLRAGGGAWSSESIAVYGDVETADLGFDGSARPHVTFWEDGPNEPWLLRHATRP